MKSNLKKQALIAVLLTVGLSTVGCIETVNPFCNKNNLIEIQGLEGSYAQSFISNSDFEKHDSDLKITKFDRARYKMSFDSDVLEFTTCKFNNNIVMEHKTKHNTYTQSIVTVGMSGSLSMSTLIFSVSDLLKNNIQHKIIERDAEESFQGFKLTASNLRLLGSAYFDKEEPQKERILVINNQNQSENNILSVIGSGFMIASHLNKK